uniref:Uncharacterized protein n=1 Tax=Faecalibaculum rodentium TaxID=1702221 RepID=A0A140DSS2_9FIRM|nr:hypothetical protein AALO17_05650 [Faecalibaculum rodentium]
MAPFALFKSYFHAFSQRTCDFGNSCQTGVFFAFDPCNRRLWNSSPVG